MFLCLALNWELPFGLYILGVPPRGPMPVRWVVDGEHGRAAPMYHPVSPCLGRSGPKPWLVLWPPHAVPLRCLSPRAPSSMAPAHCVASIPSRELPLPVLPLPALPNNDGPGSLGCSFEFKCGQPSVYKNNKSPSNRVM